MASIAFSQWLLASALRQLLGKQVAVANAFITGLHHSKKLTVPKQHIAVAVAKPWV